MNFRFFSGSSMPFNPSRNCCEASTTVRLIPKCSERSFCTCSHSLSLMTPSTQDCQLFLSSWGIGRAFQQLRQSESGNPTSEIHTVNEDCPESWSYSFFLPRISFISPGGSNGRSLGGYVLSCLRRKKVHGKYIPWAWRLQWNRHHRWLHLEPDLFHRRVCGFDQSPDP